MNKRVKMSLSPGADSPVVSFICILLTHLRTPTCYPGLTRVVNGWLAEFRDGCQSRLKPWLCIY